LSVHKEAFVFLCDWALNSGERVQCLLEQELCMYQENLFSISISG